MKLFKVYFIIFAIVITFIGISRFFSPTYIVNESIIVNMPIDSTFAYLSNLKNWEEWSLWNKTLDSSLLLFYNEQFDTLGARQYLTGNLIGKGFIEVTKYNPNKLLAYKVYVRDGEITANGMFSFSQTAPNQTEISWIDSGDVGNNPIKRYMIPIVTKGTAETFRQGLARIKLNLEKPHQ